MERTNEVIQKENTLKKNEHSQSENDNVTALDQDFPKEAEGEETEYYAFDRSFTGNELKDLSRNGADIFEVAVSRASGKIEPSLVYGENTYVYPAKSTWFTYTPGTKVGDGRFVGENDNFVLVDFNGDEKELQLFRKMSDNQARELLKAKGYSEEAAENYAYLSTSKNTYSPMFLLAERMRREDHLKINIPTRYNEDIPSKEQVEVVLKKITDVMGARNEIDFTGPFHDSNEVITGIKRDAAGKLYFKAKSHDFGEYDRPLLRVPDGKLNTSVRPADIYADILAVEFKEVEGRPDKVEHIFKTPYEFPVPNGKYDTWENAQIKSAEIFHSTYAEGHDGIRLRDTDGNEYAFDPNIHEQSLDVLERFDEMVTAIRTDKKIDKVINSERSTGRWHQGESRVVDGEDVVKDDVPLQNGESQKESENASLSDKNEVSKENKQDESQGKEHSRGLRI